MRSALVRIANDGGHRARTRAHLHNHVTPHFRVRATAVLRRKLDRDLGARVVIHPRRDDIWAAHGARACVAAFRIILRRAGRVSPGARAPPRAKTNMPALSREPKTFPTNTPRPHPEHVRTPRPQRARAGAAPSLQQACTHLAVKQQVAIVPILIPLAVAIVRAPRIVQVHVTENSNHQSCERNA